MTGYEKIEKALAKKGWTATEISYEPISYGREGREGGWQVDIDDENCSDATYDKLEVLQNEIHCDGEYVYGSIMAFNIKTALNLIDQLPVWKPLGWIE